LVAIFQITLKQIPNGSNHFSSLVIKLPEREADHSHNLIHRLKIGGTFLPLQLYAWCVDKDLTLIVSVTFDTRGLTTMLSTYGLLKSITSHVSDCKR
jgi:hypothetical protein